MCSQLAQRAGLDMATQIESVGIGTPGSVNPHTGVVEFNANFGYRNWPLVSAMEKLLPCRVYIENDANAAAYGEYIAGAAQGAKYAIAVTLGTGIGGGIIIDGKIFSGFNSAGAYGGEIKDVLACATFLDETGAERTLQAGELQLGYRTSVFEREPWCILSATFTLREDDTGPIRERMADYARRRMEKQPLDMPSAGSTFKRPEGAYAGALIDQCGLRGYAIGGAQVSQKHCGFIVNTGNATCADVLCLADTVCKIVTDETGFRLEKEVRVVK